MREELVVARRRYPNFLTVVQAAEILGISRGAAYTSTKLYRERNVAEGLPNFKVAGSLRVDPVAPASVEPSNRSVRHTRTVAGEKPCAGMTFRSLADGLTK